MAAPTQKNNDESQFAGKRKMPPW